MVDTDSEKSHSVGYGIYSNLYFLRLNGESLWNIKYQPFYPSKLHLTPGQHEIVVKWNRRLSSAVACYYLDAELGASYTFRHRVRDYSVQIWVEDSQTGEEMGTECEQYEAEQAGADLTADVLL